ncbi:MAG: type II toxin-antitoxin system VapC family toxin [Gemmatimonadetes bacterium]|nr:type II toxin-antitoxin system VapC family toxin [Gemmatimonadota bacterium]
MDGGLILETTFVVALERELSREAPGPAQEFLASHPSEPLYLTFTIAGELAAGMPLEGRPRWEQFIAPFHTLPCTADVCWEYGQTFRYLKANGLLIATNDLWIAATAVACGKPLVTANARHFGRVPRLQVLTYGGADSAG